MADRPLPPNSYARLADSAFRLGPAILLYGLAAIDFPPFSRWNARHLILASLALTLCIRTIGFGHGAQVQ
jgi:hypothetical protein